jgi:RNA polymerase-binding transcription factor
MQEVSFMEKELLDSLAQLLRGQRNHFLQEFHRSEKGLDAIAEERESELEEHAQEEQTARFLTRLDDRTLRTIQDIDAALQRILDGTYGNCEGCDKVIPIARLRSLPAARFCTTCAAQSEAQPVIAGAGTETASTGAIPADLTQLNDGELIETIHEHLKEDGRVDMEELHFVCRKGVVFLSGKLPSEAEHQILLHTLTDVLGFKEIVDHLDIEELLWESDRRAREVPPEQTTRWEDSPGTEDIVETNEDGTEFIAPAKPTPEEQ